MVQLEIAAFSHVSVANTLAGILHTAPTRSWLYHSLQPVWPKFLSFLFIPELSYFDSVKHYMALFTSLSKTNIHIFRARVLKCSSCQAPSLATLLQTFGNLTSPHISSLRNRTWTISSLQDQDSSLSFSPTPQVAALGRCWGTGWLLRCPFVLPASPQCPGSSVGNSWTFKVMSPWLSSWHSLCQRSTVKTTLLKVKVESNIKAGNTEEKVKFEILFTKRTNNSLWGIWGTGSHGSNMLHSLNQG